MEWSVLDTVEWTHSNMTNGWTEMDDRLGLAINIFKPVVYGDFIITVGGHTGSGNVADHFIVDAVENTIAVSGELDVAMREMATLLIGDVLLVFGGYDSRTHDT